MLCASLIPQIKQLECDSKYKGKGFKKKFKNCQQDNVIDPQS